MKSKTIIKREGAQIDSYTAVFEGKRYGYKIQEPTFDQLSAALAESIGLTGKLNMAGGGKVIWELCCPEFDEEIEQNARFLLSICIEIYNEYVLPADAEIKKN